MIFLIVVVCIVLFILWVTGCFQKSGPVCTYCGKHLDIMNMDCRDLMMEDGPVRTWYSHIECYEKEQKNPTGKSLLQ